MNASNGRANDNAGSDGRAPIETLLAAFDGHVADAHLRERFGELGAAFSAALGPWMEPWAVAMRGVESTAHSRAAALAMTEVARLTGTFARDAVQQLAGERIDSAGSPVCERYDALADRIDGSFREFSSSAEFDRARRAAAAAILGWLEHDRAAASSLTRALQFPPSAAPEQFDGSMPVDTEVILRDGNASLVAYPGVTETRACVILVPGFTIGSQIFDLAPRWSVARTLAARGVDAWLLDWGRPDGTDRVRTVANQLDRIDRAVDAVREATNGRRPALAGHFHGGLLALLYCIRHPGKVGALVTLSTPVEFASSEDAFARWLRACDGERLVDVFGNIPGPLCAALVAAVSPMRWCGGGFLALLEELDSEGVAARTTRFEQARRCPPAFPGETFCGLYRAFYRDNAFATGRAAELDGCRYDLSRLATPLLNVFARDDRIVPPGASIPLERWAVAASGSHRMHRGGHFDLLIGKDAHDELLPEIAAWLIAHSART